MEEFGASPEFRCFFLMSERIAYRKVAADTYAVLLGVHRHLAGVLPDARLRALIEILVSQINGWNRLGIPFRSEPKEKRWFPVKMNGHVPIGTCPI